MGAEVSVDPVIPNANPVDPGHVTFTEDGEERIVSHEAPALLNELRRTRETSRTRAGQIKSLQAERDALAARVAALEPVAAEVEKLKPLAERWHEHERAQNDALKDANAAKIKALTPDQVKLFEGITDENVIAKMLALIPAPAAATTEAEKPGAFPVGGGAGTSAGGVTLSAAETAWVKASRPDLVGRDPAVIRFAYNRNGPGKQTPAK